jgi:endonuclease/exonuclease/phosphatase family metal-dependent hydrolase
LIDGQQIAICSRFPAIRVFSEPWARGWAGAPRGFAFATLDCGGGTALNIYGLHLKSNLGDPNGNTAKREDAMEQLLKHQKEMQALDPAATRWLVCGDFNTSEKNPNVPSERTFPLILNAGFFWTFDGVPFKDRVTCPAKGRYPDACFDHIFVRGLGKPVAAPLRQFVGSDHLPVAVDLDLSNR